VFTRQNLKRVFDVQARVAIDDFTGRLQVRYKRLNPNSQRPNDK